MHVWSEGEGEGSSSSGNGGMSGSEPSGALTSDEPAVDSGEAVGQPRKKRRRGWDVSQGGEVRVRFRVCICICISIVLY